MDLQINIHLRCRCKKGVLLICKSIGKKLHMSCKMQSKANRQQLKEDVINMKLAKEREKNRLLKDQIDQRMKERERRMKEQQDIENAMTERNQMFMGRWQENMMPPMPIQGYRNESEDLYARKVDEQDQVIKALIKMIDESKSENNQQNTKLLEKLEKLEKQNNNQYDPQSSPQYAKPQPYASPGMNPNPFNIFIMPNGYEKQNKERDSSSSSSKSDKSSSSKIDKYKQYLKEKIESKRKVKEEELKAKQEEERIEKEKEEAERKQLESTEPKLVEVQPSTANKKL